MLTYGELRLVKASQDSLLREYRVKTQEYDRKIRELEICYTRTEVLPDDIARLFKKVGELDKTCSGLAVTTAAEQGIQKGTHHWIDYLIMAAISGGVALLVSLR